MRGILASRARNGINIDGGRYCGREMILPSNHIIRPIDIKVLLSAGILQIE